jgi:hypothetical protein
MCDQLRMCFLIPAGLACWLALTPATAQAQRGRAIANAAANHIMGSGYGYGGTGYLGGLGHRRFYGGYTTAFGNGFGNGSPWNDGYNKYPTFGYNNGGFVSGNTNRGYPAFSYGDRRSTYGNTIAYGRSRYQPAYHHDDD